MPDGPRRQLDYSATAAGLRDLNFRGSGSHAGFSIVVSPRPSCQPAFGLRAKRAQRLVLKVLPDPIDPQFRIASPEGDRWIAITLTENAKQRARRLGLVSDFMAWKLSPGFVVAIELHEAVAVLSVGLKHNDYAAAISLIDRKPNSGTSPSFSTAKWVRRENMDPIILSLLFSEIDAPPIGANGIQTFLQSERISS